MIFASICERASSAFIFWDVLRAASKTSKNKIQMASSEQVVNNLGGIWMMGIEWYHSIGHFEIWNWVEFQIF